MIPMSTSLDFELIKSIELYRFGCFLLSQTIMSDGCRTHAVFVRVVRRVSATFQAQKKPHKKYQNRLKVLLDTL